MDIEHFARLPDRKTLSVDTLFDFLIITAQIRQLRKSYRRRMRRGQTHGPAACGPRWLKAGS